jgi:FkbM family methyltransferase
MTNQELNEFTAADLLAKAEQDRKCGAFTDAEAAFLVGMKRFPSRLDKYGHPIFHKELVRMLLDIKSFDKAMKLLPHEKSVGGGSWHCILFARAYTAQNDVLNAELWWNLVLEKEPNQPEARIWLFNKRQGRSGSYPEPFSDIIMRCKNVDMSMIFDVGANDGESCLNYSRVFPDSRILTFEPVPKTFAKLLDNTSRTRNIMPMNIALGDIDGNLSMQISGTSTMNRVVSGSNPGSRLVQACRLDTFCNKSNIHHINFLKIDTEGHDFSVLAGCGEFIKNIDFIQCEASANDYNQFHNSYLEIFKFMTSKSFYLFKIYGQTFEWGNGGYPVCRRLDAVFINKKMVGEMKNIVSK